MASNGFPCFFDRCYISSKVLRRAFYGFYRFPIIFRLVSHVCPCLCTSLAYGVIMPAFFTAWRTLFLRPQRPQRNPRSKKKKRVEDSTCREPFHVMAWWAYWHQVVRARCKIEPLRANLNFAFVHFPFPPMQCWSISREIVLKTDLWHTASTLKVGGRTIKKSEIKICTGL